jgi:hypothetical protein
VMLCDSNSVIKVALKSVAAANHPSAIGNGEVFSRLLSFRGASLDQISNFLLGCRAWKSSKSRVNPQATAFTPSSG